MKEAKEQPPSGEEVALTRVRPDCVKSRDTGGHSHRGVCEGNWVLGLENSSEHVASFKPQSENGFTTIVEVHCWAGDDDENGVGGANTYRLPSSEQEKNCSVTADVPPIVPLRDANISPAFLTTTSSPSSDELCNVYVCARFKGTP